MATQSYVDYFMHPLKLYCNNFKATIVEVFYLFVASIDQPCLISVVRAVSVISVVK